VTALAARGKLAVAAAETPLPPAFAKNTIGKPVAAFVVGGPSGGAKVGLGLIATVAGAGFRL
jgi:hypothetical protein